MSVNVKNPAIKRIHADVRELMKDPSDQYHAAPLEDNLFEWHFTVRGPPETAFEGGIYHGRILLPPDYPFRPPDIVFTTPNGRFKTGTKVCLTISSYHPEYWQPAWGIRLILEALISFLPTESMGALGGLDWTPAERKRLAAESRDWACYKCGRAADLLPESQSRHGLGSQGNRRSPYADQIAQLHRLKVKTAADVQREEADGEAVLTVENGRRADASPPNKVNVAQGIEVGTIADDDSVQSRGVEDSGNAERSKAGGTDEGSEVNAEHTGQTIGLQSWNTSEAESANKAAEDKVDDWLAYIAMALAVCILGILIRKVVRWLGTR